MGRRRGFFAELERAGREAERAQKRRQRELERERREFARARQAQERDQAKRDARYEVNVYENHMSLLTSVHQDATAPIVWDSVASSPAPTMASVNTTVSEELNEAIQSFRPTGLQKLFGGAKKKLARMNADLQEALATEDAQRRRVEEEHRAALEDWQSTVELARGVLAKDTDAYNRVIEETEALQELADLGCRIAVSWHDSDIAVVTLDIQGSEVVPTQVKSLTKAGKLSTKKMPQGLFWETYQDFVCGAALRAARELLAVLPIETVLSNVTTSMLNTATGHEEPRVILSVFCVRAPMSRINFARADASDVVSTFVHAMRFKRSKGLEPVDALDPAQSSVVLSP
ncbi:MAG: hypothetical protein RLO06_05290 [Parvibaculum sp.]